MLYCPILYHGTRFRMKKTCSWWLIFCWVEICGITCSRTCTSQRKQSDTTCVKSPSLCTTYATNASSTEILNQTTFYWMNMRPYIMGANTPANEILQTFIKIQPCYPLAWSPGMKSLLIKLLCVDDQQRTSSLSELQDVEYLSEVNWDAVLNKQILPGFLPNRRRLNCDPTFELEEMILESKPLHKKKKRLARKTRENGSDGSPQRSSDGIASSLEAASIPVNPGFSRGPCLNVVAYQGPSLNVVAYRDLHLNAVACRGPCLNVVAYRDLHLNAVACRGPCLNAVACRGPCLNAVAYRGPCLNVVAYRGPSLNVVAY
ncbi:Serine/threonine-protein kinase 32A [Triplophysa tibetana]|uniref:Serine/threonine-protein kinase 32A n=1 Tax=Triplophysa tibetana TaxID=1572043 RepID=A0A5A9PHT6_9TELE|nr:Serine/threonine-protein kinase 32A [Triplophysa tibetana]